MMNAELLGYPGRPPRTASPRLLGYAGRTTRNMSPRLVGLGDYTEGTDFTCANGVCVPALASVNVLADFSTLQGQLNRLLVASGMAPLTVDGQLGPSTLAAAQQMISHYGIQIAVPQTVDQLAAQTQLYAAEFESTGTINNLPQPTTSTSTAAAPYLGRSSRRGRCHRRSGHRCGRGQSAVSSWLPRVEVPSCTIVGTTRPQSPRSVAVRGAAAQVARAVGRTPNPRPCGNGAASLVRPYQRTRRRLTFLRRRRAQASALLAGLLCARSSSLLLSLSSASAGRRRLLAVCSRLGSSRCSR